MNYCIFEEELLGECSSPSIPLSCILIDTVIRRRLYSSCPASLGILEQSNTHRVQSPQPPQPQQHHTYLSPIRVNKHTGNQTPCLPPPPPQRHSPQLHINSDNLSRLQPPQKTNSHSNPSATSPLPPKTSRKPSRVIYHLISKP